MNLYNKLIIKLIRENITISTAESCTGGLLAYSITKNKDSSKIYKGGYVVYSNELKIKELNVKKTTLKNFGAVSKETAKEMLKGLFLKTKTNICISTTGIAGPGGGSIYKPIGLVYIGVQINGKLTVLKKNFKGSRIDIQKKCVNYIFEYLSNSI